MANPWELDWTSPQAPAAGGKPWERDWSQGAQPPQGQDELSDAVFGADDAARALQIGAQGAGRGIADLAGTPVDLLTLGLNAVPALVESGANLFLDDENALSLPRIENPVGGGEWFAGMAGRGAEALGADLIDTDALEGQERLAYNVNRFGVGAGVGAAGLSRAAAGRLAATQGGGRATPGPGDFMLRPYAGPNPARTVTADAVGGMGAGAGLTYAEDRYPDNELMQAVFMLGGGAGGNVAGAVGHAPADTARALSRFAADPDIPYDTGQMRTTSKRVGDAGARLVQEQATEPSAASGRIAERTATARQSGVPEPTSGIASDDIGLIGLERALRQSPGATDPTLRRRFLERDQAIRDGAGAEIGSLTDPDADLAGGLDYARNRPAQLAAARDQEAMPLLRQAEESGAAVDAQPVADLIDGMLTTSKRPAVVNALRDARQQLNAVGSDDLDTSLTGLYETRKAINDIIEGRTDNATGRYAKSELIEVRNALDKALTDVVPEFGEYLDAYRTGSRPLDVFDESRTVSRMVGTDTDLRNTARRLLTGNEYGRGEAMREIQSVVGRDPEAARAWRASVAEVLHDQVSSRARDGELSMAQIRRVWSDHRDTLAEVFSPEDMATLERGHEMLAPLQNLAQQTVPGSATIDNARLVGMLEASILTATGNAITTGMIMKRIKTAANLIPGIREASLPYKTAQLVERAMFDPDLMRLLLERPVSEATGPAWSRQLRSVMAATEWSRETYGGDENDEMLDAIDGGGQ